MDLMRPSDCQTEKVSKKWLRIILKKIYFKNLIHSIMVFMSNLLARVEKVENKLLV